MHCEVLYSYAETESKEVKGPFGFCAALSEVVFPGWILGQSNLANSTFLESMHSVYWDFFFFGPLHLFDEALGSDLGEA